VSNVTTDGGETWWQTFLGELVLVVVAQHGHLVAVVQQPAANGSQSLKAVNWVYVSRDGGRHWSYDDQLGAQGNGAGRRTIGAHSRAPVPPAASVSSAVRDVLSADGMALSSSAPRRPLCARRSVRWWGSRAGHTCGAAAAVWTIAVSGGTTRPLTACRFCRPIPPIEVRRLPVRRLPHAQRASPPGRGLALATTRGLRIGDALARGRQLYGRSFAISAAQGGSWDVRVAGGLISGYAWGHAQARRRRRAEQRRRDD
jgi:hypothetical protein